MIVKHILGYWVTNDADILDTFIAQASERYDALENGLKPTTEAVEDLERDWSTRWPDYWMAMAQNFMVLRDAARACMYLFTRERSSRLAPVPLVVPATAPDYTYALNNLLDVLERAGILLTSYSAVCQSMEQRHLRQRQEVLRALREVNEATREAITEGRAELEQAPMLHVRLISGPSEEAAQGRVHSGVHSSYREVR
jgi:hypothetical protein